MLTDMIDRDATKTSRCPTDHDFPSVNFKIIRNIRWSRRIKHKGGRLFLKLLIDRDSTVIFLPEQKREYMEGKRGKLEERLHSFNYHTVNL